MLHVLINYHFSYILVSIQIFFNFFLLLTNKYIIKEYYIYFFCFYFHNIWFPKCITYDNIKKYYQYVFIIKITENSDLQWKP